MNLNFGKYHIGWLLSALVGLVVLLGLSNPAKAQEIRIVSIDGSLTEIVYALGKGGLVVGRDTTSTYPEAAIKLPDVGYMRALSAEGILSLRPTLVLVTSDAKPQKVLTQLKKAGVQVEIIENRYSIEGVEHKILKVAEALGIPEDGKRLVSKMRKEVEQAQTKARALQKDGQVPNAIFVLNMRKGNMMVAGADSRADQLMKMIGIHNPVAQYFNGYKPLTPEAAVKYNPQYILTMQQSVQSSGGVKSMKQSTVLQMTDAGKNGRIIVLENSDLSFGPRLGQALNNLTSAIFNYSNRTG